MEGILLILGAGSIGRRHAKNAHALGARLIICDLDIKRAEELAGETDALGFYSDVKKACEQHSDIVAVVVATPSKLHIENAEFFVEKGIHVFMEKPLAVENMGIDDLVRNVELKKVVFMMAQSYRFHEGFLALKKLLDENAIGKVYHVNYFGGQYLPGWHSGEDYRKEYAAQRRQGGGVNLTSMSHSFDAIGWLFGDIADLTGWEAKLSNLEIDVDDSFFCLMRTNKNVIIMCQTDFLQRTSKHRMVIVGEKGNIEADFVTHEITLECLGEKRVTQKYLFEPNQRYIDELQHFMQLIKDGTVKHPLDIYAGKRVVELMLEDTIKPITEI